MPFTYLTYRERFEQKFVKDRKSKCWVWTASLYAGHKSGDKTFPYGNFTYEGRAHPAHRISWVLYRGPIKRGMKVLHKCDNPRCVNPAHLFLGTQKDNIADMDTKGRRALGRAGGRAKLSAAIVRQLRRASAQKSYAALAAEFGVSDQTVRSVVLRHTWKHVA